MTLERLASAWNRFWFAPQSPLPIAAYRILFGLIVLVFALMLAPDWLAYFSDRGMLSSATSVAMSGGLLRLSLFPLLPSGDAWVMALLFLLVGSAICLTLGAFTRLSAILVFVCLMSLHVRNPFIFNGADTFMRVAAFILIFSPAGAAMSLDRLWRVARGRESGPPAPCAPWAQRLLQLQLATVYLSTALLKSNGEMWLDGTALYYTARLEDFWRLPVPYVFDHLWSIKFATWATLLVEFALGVLIWFRDIRYLVLLAGLMLHLGIEWSMNVPLFSAMMLSAYVAFLEPAQFRRSLTWLKARLPQMPSPTSERAHATVFYDGRCRLCRLTRDLLQCLDVFRVLRFVDFRSPDLADGWPGFDHARAEREMLLCSPENEWCSGYHAFRWMSLRVPLLWPLAAMSLLPGASQVGTRIYGWVSVRRRLLLGRACADEACILPKRA